MQDYGKRLVQYGLNSGNAGNMSVRIDASQSLLITRTGTMLEELLRDDVILLPLISANKNDDAKASSELPMHRAICEATSHKAIIHAHAPMAIVMSLVAKGDVFEPIDIESACYLKRIPIVTGATASLELARNVAQALKDNDSNVCIIKGHGVVAAGGTLKEAYSLLSLTELAAKISVVSRQMSVIK